MEVKNNFLEKEKKMSELNSTIEFLENSEVIINPPTDDFETPIESVPDEEIRVFDIQEFGQELYRKSEIKNRARAQKENQNITGYDIAHNCIQQVLFKLRNTPLENYADLFCLMEPISI